MASLASSGFTLPNHLVAGVWKSVQTMSAIAKLCGAEPQKFGVQQYMTLTAAPKGEVVGEGAQKSYSNPAFAPVNALTRKVQVTQRFNEEVLWADEDYQLGVLTTMKDLSATALSRALDLIAIHGINPLTGVLLSGSPVKLVDTTNVIEVTDTSKPDLDIEAAVALILAGDLVPNGIALAPAFSYAYATQRDSDDRLLHPEAGFGLNVSAIGGLAAAMSSTVSAPEATVEGGAYASDNPNVKAIVGDWSAFRWGVQREIPIEVIKFGDPDGQGDLKRSNQIALRAEVVYGIGILAIPAFAKIIDDEAVS
jgi:hypothetical protein